jgi:uncharacterized protein YqjF (DUF2071 family)
MGQEWVNLTFIHFAIDPEVIQQSLPEGLSVDVFPDSSGVEKAWLGLVPFEIRDLSFSRGWRVPSASRFLETNVRTYVHRDGKEPGVWFYSLDAASRLACQSARTWYGLPYWFARMSYEESGNQRRYQGERQAGLRPSCRVEVEVGAGLSAPEPGSFEFFLVERYLLYSVYRGRIQTGRVHHAPYPVYRARLLRLEDQLVSAAGFKVDEPVSVLFSPGVSVDVFRLS